MAATTGFALLSMTSNIVQSVGACTALGVLNSRISAPAEKARPTPVITIAVTAGASSARSIASTMPVRVARSSPFTGGLSRLTMATPSRVSYRTVITGPSSGGCETDPRCTIVHHSCTMVHHTSDLRPVVPPGSARDRSRAGYSASCGNHLALLDYGELDSL